MDNKKAGSILLLAVFLSGCTHQLNIKNLNSYYGTTSAFVKQQLHIGLRTNSSDFEGRKISKMTADSLNRCNVRVTTSFLPDDVDVVATMRVQSDYKGSGWNFLINFPGFLVWAPAWHGYHYTVSHNINVELTESKTGARINTLNIPVVLNIRHADISRTWTEVSWLEFGVIAFVGGIVFINYDDEVTPMVTDKAGPVLADYIAQEIVSSLLNVKPIAKPVKTVAIPVSSQAVSPKPLDEDVAQKKLTTLKSLYDKGLLTSEEYERSRSAVASTMSASALRNKDSASNYEINDFQIIEYQFDSVSGEGNVTVDISGKGFNARLWIVKNIGMICSSKNVALDSGQESFDGAKYMILDESIQDGLLKIVFKAVY